MITILINSKNVKEKQKLLEEEIRQIHFKIDAITDHLTSQQRKPD